MFDLSSLPFEFLMQLFGAVGSDPFRTSASVSPRTNYSTPRTTNRAFLGQAPRPQRQPQATLAEMVQIGPWVGRSGAGSGVAV